MPLQKSEQLILCTQLLRKQIVAKRVLKSKFKKSLKYPKEQQPGMKSQSGQKEESALIPLFMQRNFSVLREGEAPLFSGCPNQA